MNAHEFLRLTCPKCSASVRAQTHLAGKRLKCPKCGGAIKVPGATAQSADDEQWLSLDEPLRQPAGIKPAPVATKTDRPAPEAVRRSQGSDAVKPGPQQPAARPANSSESANWMDELPPLVPPVPHARRAAPGNDFDAGELEALQRAGGFDFDSDPLGDTPPAAKPPTPIPGGPNAPGGGEGGEYRAKCPVCDSLHHVHPRQAGKTIRCGDCYSQFVVPPPPKIVPKKKIDLERAPTFQLSEIDSLRGTYAGPEAKSAAEYLRAAEEEDAPEDSRHHYDNPDVGLWLRGMFGIFTDPAVVAYWLGLSMLGAIPGGLAIAIGHMGIAGGVLIIAVLVGSLLYSALVLACAFAILESVANGNRTVDEWPVFNPADWFGPPALAIFAAVLSALPGAMFAGLVFDVGLASLACVMLSIFVLFPFVLLSMLDNGSAVMPVSSSVTKSVSRCKDAWGLLYFSSMLLFFFHYLLVAFITVLAPPIVSIFFSSMLTVAMVFIYFSMIGQLAYAIGQTINAPLDEEED